MLVSQPGGPQNACTGEMNGCVLFFFPFLSVVRGIELRSPSTYPAHRVCPACRSAAPLRRAALASSARPRCQKVLLALSVAIVVASSEAVLYLIWQGRRSRPASPRILTRSARRLGPRQLRPTNDMTPSHDKKVDTESDAQEQESAVVFASAARAPGTGDSALRERTVASDEGRVAAA